MSFKGSIPVTVDDYGYSKLQAFLKNSDNSLPTVAEITGNGLHGHTHIPCKESKVRSKSSCPDLWMFVSRSGQSFMQSLAPAME